MSSLVFCGTASFFCKLMLIGVCNQQVDIEDSDVFCFGDFTSFDASLGAGNLVFFYVSIIGNVSRLLYFASLDVFCSVSPKKGVVALTFTAYIVKIN